MKDSNLQVIRELTHAVIKSRNVATLTRAFNGRSAPGSTAESRRSLNRLRSSLRGLKRHLRQTNSGPSKVREKEPLCQCCEVYTRGGMRFSKKPDIRFLKVKNPVFRDFYGQKKNEKPGKTKEY